MLQLILALVVVIGAGFTVWVNLNIEMTKLKSTVTHLEDNDVELKVLLTDISTRLHHIELLLASNQIKEK